MPGITRHVEQHYRTLIDNEPPGGQLPSERTVMRELAACRSTIRIVLTKLVAEKLIYPVHGKGYYKA